MAKVLDEKKKYYQECVEELKKIQRQVLNRLSSLEKNNKIDLSGKCLLIFFFSKAISDDYFRTDYWFSDASSSESLAEAFENLNKIVQYLLADFTMDSETIQAIIWMVSEYCHNSLGIPARIDLRSHLLHAARGEPGLYSLKHYYRDHFFHALEVCFLGHLLLELETGNGKQLWEKVASQMKLTGNKQEKQKQVLRFWYLAALMHDIGYGIDLLKGVRDLLAFFKNSEPLKGLEAKINGALCKLSEEHRNDNFAGYKPEDKPGEDHGVVASRHLHGLIKSIAEEDKEVDLNEYESSIWAIALHNHRKQQVTFSEKPLAFLLILCDTIQEWNRLHFNFATSPADILAKLQGAGIKEEDLKGPLKKIFISASLYKKITEKKLEGRLKCKSRTLHFILEYGDEINKNSGVFNLWLDASCNFQRLSFEGLDDIEIKIEYLTPLFKNREGKIQWQYYRLSDAAREMHMGFLQKWFPTKQEKKKEKGNDILYITNGAIEYYPPTFVKDSELGREKLVIDLRKLCEKKWISKNIDEFRLRLAKWKHYNDDRDFSGDYANIIPD